MEITDWWNWLRSVFILGLVTEDVETLGSATRVSVLCRNICCGDSRCVEQAQNCVHCRPGH